MSVRPSSKSFRGDCDLVRLALKAPLDESGTDLARELTDAADRRTTELIDRFVHANGPTPARFAWVALGSHARRELHCASDQDHALLWDDARAAASSYAKDLAAEVIEGLAEFGMRRCSGGYMADRWSRSLDDWVLMLHDHVGSPTPEAVLDTDIFLDMRPLAGDLDISVAFDVLHSAAESSRLLHGLAVAANSFPVPLSVWGRLPREEVDLKKGGLAAVVLLARLYGLQAGAAQVGTVARYHAAQVNGVLSPDLCARLIDAFRLLMDMRMRHQIAQVNSGEPLSDRVAITDLSDAEQDRLRAALRTVKEAQGVTAVIFRTDL